MAFDKCPGVNPRNWRPEDIHENACPQCNRTIEFWKDDVKQKCPGCGKIMFNPKLGSLCLSWCDKAVECIGNMDIEEWKKQTAGHRKDKLS